MDTMLSPKDLAYQASCREYAATELVEIEKKYGEINEVPAELRRSMANAGLFKQVQRLLVVQAHAGAFQDL